MKPKHYLYFLFTALSLVNTSFLKAQTGEELFNNNCKACHTTTDQKLVGPGLKDVKSRWKEEKNLILWVQNSQEYLKKNPKDSYAQKMYEANGKVPMPSFALTEENIKSILAYIEQAATTPPPATTSTAATTQPNIEEEKKIKDNTGLTLVIAILSLLIVIFALTKVRKSLEKALAAKKGEEAPKTSFGTWVYNNKKAATLLFLVVILFTLKVIWDALLGIGVYQGYQPKQPIAFSHKVHAGQNKISCNYCHSSAERGRTSGIPSANVCMNCHKAVQEGTTTGKTEIAKIYKALDYDPQTGTYGNNPKPIEWIKIHNLPDHVYFSHQQHVVAGKIECQTCHGPVQEMKEVYQYSPLTMGWCINCHRETKVQAEGNAYYTKLHDKFKEKYKDNPKAILTVDKIGGLECAKCHY